MTAGCGVDTTPPPIVGDRGDVSGQGLKVGCTLSRSEILSSVSGGRRTAIERGFAWYDAKVPYSQSSQYDSYRTDCSGFVSMCWQLGTSYTTANFIKDTSEWTSLASFDDLVPADAMVYRKGGSGHIVMFVGWNDAAKTEACVLEQASTKDDMQFRARTTSSLVSGGYHAIRATKFGAGTGTGSGTGGSKGGECFCDAECSSNGDCCASCPGGTGGSSGSGGSGGSSGSGNASGSGGSGNASGSGGSSGQCFCDSECVAAGDCCASCPNGTGGSSGSGGSGGSGKRERQRRIWRWRWTVFLRFGVRCGR